MLFVVEAVLILWGCVALAWRLRGENFGMSLLGFCAGLAVIAVVAPVLANVNHALLG